MTNEFIAKEVDSIIDGPGFDFPVNFAMGAAWISAHFKGENLKVINIRGLCSVSDYFILATAENRMQMEAMCDEIARQFRRKGLNVISREGVRDSEWALLDYGHFMVHIFEGKARETYDLDTLWQQGQRIDIPNDFYVSSPNAIPTSSKLVGDYT